MMLLLLLLSALPAGGGTGVLQKAVQTAYANREASCMTKRDPGELFLLKESLLENGVEEGGGEGGDAEIWNDAAGNFFQRQSARNQSNGNEWKSLSQLRESRIRPIDAAAPHSPSVAKHRWPAAQIGRAHV